MTSPIGIFGSIFDPVHHGHLAAAQLAKNYFNLDTVIFIPAGVPPHKAHSVSVASEHRLAMLKLALHDFAGAEIWDEELKRDGFSYTIDTLELLEKKYSSSSFYFIIGADNLHELHTWHRYKEILSKVTLCVTSRPGYSIEVPATLAQATICTFPSPEWGLSSTTLRTFLAQGYDCRYLLPGGVYSYIRQNGLYRSPA